MVIEREPGSILAARTTMDMLHEWGVSSNMVSAMVVNRARLSINVSATDIGSQLDCEVLGVVPAAEAFFIAQQNGMPLVTLQPDNDASRVIIEMTSRLTAGQLSAVRR